MYELILGDCLDILRSMPARSIDCILTDPPYVISAGRNCGFTGARQYLRDITDAGMEDGFDPIILDECMRVLRAPNLILFCSRLQLRDHLNWCHARGFNWALICWHKSNPTPLTASGYLPDTEYILHFWKDVRLRGPYSAKRHFHLHPASKNVFGHPTVKPLPIIKTLLLNAATAPGSIILDPFMGSGTTGVAAIELGHRFIGVEIDGDYLAIAKKRIAQARPAFQLNLDLKAKDTT